ncbi:hypothetical protein PISMIDRAFT_672637 [Pisolithus microcarpus 441]|uniref:Uncharacterized protein n=1 Tax=Pisolithus microcarpus 441 TaxID=765257 RepID=A0A0D0A490_9AGAM|nr:hypothetical protein PISMIDRAFT_672637 [Pisolithus microcarpus 441]
MIPTTWWFLPRSQSGTGVDGDPECPLCLAVPMGAGWSAGRRGHPRPDMSILSPISKRPRYMQYSYKLLDHLV